jgi:hypothetical protein
LDEVALPETPTVYFPDDSVEFGFTFAMSFNTIETRFSNRRRQARLLDARPQRTLEGRIPAILWDTSEGTRAFVTARGGNFEPFYIFAWMRQQFTGFAWPGVADGLSTGPFIFPFKKATITNVILKLGGAQTLGTDYTVTDFPGLETYLTFTSPPIAGDYPIADILGRERIPVVLNGNVLHVEHPLHRAQNAAGPADFYSIPVIEVF